MRSAWWYQSVMRGRLRSTKRWITWVSGSEAGPGPDSYTPSRCRQREGEVRFRATPAEFLGGGGRSGRRVGRRGHQPASHGQRCREDGHLSEYGGGFVTAALAERAAAQGRIAIDTEFVSERRYQALLCLAQVAVPDPSAPGGVRTEVLDPIEHELDPAPLAQVLADPAIEIVVHAGRQDVAILRRTWGTDITNVFDTQIAAGFGGLRAQMGY